MSVSAEESVPGSATPPNVIFILADDLGYGDLGCFGQENFKTPNIDQMAAGGMRFTQHYAGSTVCAPSRACLLTGFHTGHVYQRANGSLQFREDPQDACIAAQLKKAGYHTAMIGKSGLSCNSEDGALPNRKGFDYFFGYTSHAAAHRYYPRFLWRNGKKVEYANNSGKEGDVYSGDEFLRETLAYIKTQAQSKSPFFLHVSLQQPHADLNVPQAWKEPFMKRFEDKPFEGGHYRAEDHPKATFAGMVTYLDDTVGKIISQLKQSGVEKNTLVIFSSDNGAMSEGGWSRNNFGSSGALRGGKRDMYEGGIRVPMIAFWPGSIAAGSESSHISAFWDFAPTVCELAGVEIGDTDGISYAPTLLGKGEQKPHESLYWEFYEQGGKQAVRMGKWKGIRLDVHKDIDGPIELFNLEVDLGETQDVASANPEVVEQVRALLQREHRSGELETFRSEKQRDATE